MKKEAQLEYPQHLTADEISHRKQNMPPLHYLMVVDGN